MATPQRSDWLRRQLGLAATEPAPPAEPQAPPALPTTAAVQAGQAEHPGPSDGGPRAPAEVPAQVGPLNAWLRGDDRALDVATGAEPDT